MDPYISLKSLLSLLYLLLVMLLLGACSEVSDQPNPVNPLKPPLPQRQKTISEDDDVDPVLDSGLIPLPTPNDVISSAGSGRQDPFAPPESYKLPLPRIKISGMDQLERISRQPIPSQPTTESILEEITGFHLVGVSGGAGKNPVAYVNYKGDNGYINIGATGNELGRMPTPFLPRGWTLSRINLLDGSITIQREKSRVLLYVGSMPLAENVQLPDSRPATQGVSGRQQMQQQPSAVNDQRLNELRLLKSVSN